MAESQTTDLLYGHPGEPYYDKDSKTWSFKRRIGITQEIRSLGSPVQVLPAVNSTNSIRAGALGRLEGRKELLQHYPEIVPAAFLPSGWDMRVDGAENQLIESVQLSEAVQDLAEAHSTSDLFAFGRISNLIHGTTNKLDADARYPRLLAVVAGIHREVLRLILLSNERIKWNVPQSLELEASTAYEGEEGFWLGDGQPIQQVIFAQGTKRAETLLAARTPSSIHFFHPQLCSDPVSPARPQRRKLRLPASRLDANHVVSLHAKRAGLALFTDVAFSPFKAHQFAVVDEDGTWSVWLFDRPDMKSKNWSASMTHRCNLYTNTDTIPDNVEVLQDRWAKIVWATDFTTLFVASRREVRVLGIKDQAKSLPILNFELLKPSDWILDVKQYLSDPGKVFVLTSTRLCLLQVHTQAEKSMGRTSPTALLHCSWVHFRDPNDFSLSLDVFQSSSLSASFDASKTPHGPLRSLRILDKNPEKENSTNLLRHPSRTAASGDKNFVIALYSQNNALASIFSFVQFNQTGHIASLCDPFLLPLESHRQAKRLDRTAVSPICSQAKRLCMKCVAVNPKGTGLQLGPQNLKVFKMYSLGSDGGFVEQIFVIDGVGRSTTLSQDYTITRESFRKTDTRVLDDFIVPDGVTELKSILNRRSPQNSVKSGDRLEIYPSSEHGSIDMQWLVQEIRSSKFAAFLLQKEAKNDPDQETVPFESYLQSIRREIESKFSDERPGIELMSELNPEDPTTADIDFAALNLSQYLEENLIGKSEQGNEQTGMFQVIGCLPTTMRNDLGLPSETGLDHVYDSLISTYLRPLSKLIPARLRMAVEKYLRIFAVYICLATHGIQLVDRNTGDVESVPQESLSIANHEFNIPLRKKKSASDLNSRKAEEDHRAMNQSSISPDLQAATPSSPLSQKPRLQKPTLDETTPASPSLARQTPAKSSQIPSNLKTDSTLRDPQSSEMEDPSSIRLRALAKLNPQPRLPTKLTNLLSHWTVGADPDTYDWAATDKRLNVGGLSQGEDDLSKKRKKSRRSRQGMEIDDTDLGIGNSQPFLIRFASPMTIAPMSQSQSQSQLPLDTSSHEQIQADRQGGKDTIEHNISDSTTSRQQSMSQQQQETQRQSQDRGRNQDMMEEEDNDDDDERPSSAAAKSTNQPFPTAAGPSQSSDYSLNTYTGTGAGAGGGAGAGAGVGAGVGVGSSQPVPGRHGSSNIISTGIGGSRKKRLKFGAGGISASPSSSSSLRPQTPTNTTKKNKKVRAFT